MRRDEAGAPGPTAPPTTALAAAAVDYLRRTSPPILVNHCLRTYAFGAALLQQSARSFDAECLFVSSCLHDLGLLPENEDGSTPFQERGADEARAVALQLGASARTSQLVHDAVALHLELSTADHAVPEVAGVSLGAAVDVLGLRLDQVPPDVVDAALASHPRDDMKEWFARAMQDEATAKPHSTVGSYVQSLDFIGMIRAAPFAS